MRSLRFWGISENKKILMADQKPPEATDSLGEISAMKIEKHLSCVPGEIEEKSVDL
jgi:hypothetical protein